MPKRGRPGSEARNLVKFVCKFSDLYLRVRTLNFNQYNNNTTVFLENTNDRKQWIMMFLKWVWLCFFCVAAA